MVAAPDAVMAVYLAAAVYRRTQPNAIFRVRLISVALLNSIPERILSAIVIARERSDRSNLLR
jgi:hypothetical protein